MPLTIDQGDDCGAAIVRIRGLVTVREAEAEIARAYGEGRIRPGQTRVLLIDRSARLHRLDLAALSRIQDLVHRIEAAGGRPPAFRTLIVPGSIFHRAICQLYAQLWALRRNPSIVVRVVDSAETAMALARDAAADDACDGAAPTARISG